MAKVKRKKVDEFHWITDKNGNRLPVGSQIMVRWIDGSCTLYTRRFFKPLGEVTWVTWLNDEDSRQGGYWDWDYAWGLTTTHIVDKISVVFNPNDPYGLE
jgi:hypothetical protein